MRNIVLFGFMGTGKSSVGRLLASQLGLEFVDMDSVIEKRAGRTISEIFAQDGEQCFRAMERELVKELSVKEGLVIGTGGGVVLDSRNVADLSLNGLAVCLNAAPGEILNRLENDGSRPLLAQGDKLEKIKGILAARRDHYASVPVQIDTTGLSAEQVAWKIKALYCQGSAVH